ncbi:hypothetical protein JOC24_003424 [Streptomyces sp. HB132]|nr:hypothetical protein [Streptomyces sp. HB132]
MMTEDAMPVQKDRARSLVEDRHAHYLLSAKNNQPTLAGRLRKSPWGKAPVLDRAREPRRGATAAGSSSGAGGSRLGRRADSGRHGTFLRMIGVTLRKGTRRGISKECGLWNWRWRLRN